MSLYLDTVKMAVSLYTPPETMLWFNLCMLSKQFNMVLYRKLKNLLIKAVEVSRYMWFILYNNVIYVYTTCYVTIVTNSVLFYASLYVKYQILFVCKQTTNTIKSNLLNLPFSSQGFILEKCCMQICLLSCDYTIKFFYIQNILAC